MDCRQTWNKPVIPSRLQRFLKRRGGLAPGWRNEAWTLDTPSLLRRMAKSGGSRYTGIMRTLLLLMLVAAWSAPAAQADPAGRLKLDYVTPPGKELPIKGANATKSCAEYGAGFTKVAGTDTCVKVGGFTRVDVGGGGAATH
jgi:Porin subfamily